MLVPSYSFPLNLVTAMPCSMNPPQEAQWLDVDRMSEEPGSPLSHQIQWQTTPRVQIRVGEGSTLEKADIQKY